MNLRLNENWKQEMLKKIQEPDFEYTTALTLAAKWIILQLSDKKYAFRVMNIGAGVKRITRRTDACPKCHGTGRV